MTAYRDAAYVARCLGNKTPNWVKRNAHRYPHHKAGRTYFWTDADIDAMLKAMEGGRPDAAPAAGPRPMGSGRR